MVAGGFFFVRLENTGRSKSRARASFEIGRFVNIGHELNPGREASYVAVSPGLA